MKKRALLFLFYLLPIVCLAQKQTDKAMDSLLWQTAQARDDTNKVKLLNRLAESTGAQAGAEKNKYAQQALALSQKLEYKSGMADALYNIGQANTSMGMQAEALQCFVEALELYGPAGNKSGMAACHAGIAQIYILRNNLPAAMKSRLEELKLLQQTNDKNAIAFCYNALGSINRGERNYAEAKRYHLLAIALFNETNNKHGKGSTYNALGDVDENLGNYNGALENYFAALHMLEQISDTTRLAWPCYNIGEVYLYEKNYENALIYFSRALKLHLAAGDKSGAAWTENNIGNTFMRQGKYKEAEKNCLASLHAATELSDIGGMKNAYNSLSNIYDSMGNYRKALEYNREFTKAQDSMFNKARVDNLVKQQMQYDFDEKDRNAKIKQDKKDLMAIYIAALLVAAALAGIIAYRVQRKGNKLKAELLLNKEAALQQKEVLLKEVHHRVKNNLQVISTLLDLQLESITDAIARNAVTESAARLKAISLIHQQLYRSEHIASLEMKQFITDLHYQVASVFSGAGQHISFDNSMPPVQLDIDTAVPLGLIINELMTNSYKHAFMGGDGDISLRISRQDRGYVLHYTDSGSGLPAGSNIKALSGMGMTIIQALSRQTGGALSYLPDTKTFVITFRDAMDMKNEA